jgi:hypothetical protein
MSYVYGMRGTCKETALTAAIRWAGFTGLFSHRYIVHCRVLRDFMAVLKGLHDRVLGEEIAGWKGLQCISRDLIARLKGLHCRVQGSVAK